MAVIKIVPKPGPAGSPGITGAQGVQGVKGDIGLQGPTGLQGTVGPQGLTGIGTQGLTGIQGATGQAGTSIKLKGSVNSTSELPSTNNLINDAYIDQETENLFVWNGTSWIDVGQIVGPQGPQGPQGADGSTTYYSEGTGISIVDTTISIDETVVTYEELNSLIYKSPWYEITTTAEVLLDSWQLSERRVAEYTVQIAQGTSHHCEKILVVSDVNLVSYTKYGIITNGDEIEELNVSATENGNLGRLIIQISNADLSNASVQILKSVVS